MLRLKNTHRFLCLLMACLFGALLTACGQKPAPPSTLSYAQMLAMMNRPVESGFADVMTPTRWTVCQGRVWAYGWAVEEADATGAHAFCVASCLPDGSDFSAVRFLAPLHPEVKEQMQTLDKQFPTAGVYTYVALQSVVFDADGALYIIVEQSVDGEGLPQEVAADPQKPLQHYYISTLDETGALQYGPALQLSDVLLQPEQKFSYQIGLFGQDDDFWLYTTIRQPGTNTFAGSTYTCFSLADGKLKSTVPMPEGYHVWDHQRLPDGDILVMGQNIIGKSEIFCFSATAQQPTIEPLGFADAMKDRGTCNLVRLPEDAFDPPILFYGGTGTGIYRADPATGAVEQWLAWEDYSVGNPFFELVLQTDENTFFLAHHTGKTRVLTRVDDDLLAGRETLTFALPYATDQIKELINTYNAAAPKVYIQAVDYSNKAAQQKGFADGTAMLQEDIRHGTAPDILWLPNDLAAHTWIRQGLFCDLYPFLDADAEISRADLLPGIVSGSEYNGTLPTVVPSFIVLTAVGSRELVGDTPGWTWQQYDALLAAYPQAAPFYNAGRDLALLHLLQMGGDRWVDYATGQAHLDDPDFVRLLIASAAYPQEAADPLADPKAPLADREGLLEDVFIANWRDLLSLEYMFDGPVTLKGFPGSEGGSAFVPRARLGITRYCQDPEAAWQFVRQFLLPAYQDTLAQDDSGAFPLRLDALAKAAQTAQQPYPEAAPPLYLSQQLTESQQAYWQQGLTPAQTDQIMALLTSLDTLYQYDNAIADILQEEATAFYHGQRSAEEAAKIMQDRVQTYLDEQG